MSQDERRQAGGSLPRRDLLGALLALGLLGTAPWQAALAQRAADGRLEELFTSVKRNHARVTRRLIEQGVDVNVRDPETGQTPMTLALQLGSDDVFDALMASPATDVEFRNGQDESPLMIAAIRGDLDAVRRLIRQGAHVNKPGWTPLHYAASGDSDDQRAIAELLLERHAFIDAESPNRTTPLMMATHYGSNEVARLLMQAGADPLMRNQLGLSAEDFARQAGRDRLADEIARYARQVQARRQDSAPGGQSGQGASSPWVR
ncbi:ankyrin repeat domain-containing protein [Corticibacter populi]|uniref:Ankyrin repeat domain-containing protein n=1 Tax=Corticibacter populi TaxID=1550736 RepID=A0A3M6QZR2_9BURK|nr:ankyrin repeat domain-containing protein [Corticibacter populi]RMX08468.1 ankyrin repeat domain-containing protein [Corticibacter populi]RZS35780.1 hypothetical protein EV687_0858 [Corticibacter populi]